MASKFVRSSQILSNIFTNRCVSTFLNGQTGRATKLLEKTLLRTHFSLRFKRSFCIAATANTDEALKTVQNIYTAVCIERLPVLTPEKTDLARKFEELQDLIELEKSALSEDEATARKFAQKKKKLREKDEDEHFEIAQFEESRKEFQEMQEEEFNQFQPASRETEADRGNNLKTCNRKLDQTLILLLKNKNSSWEMPLTIVQDQETLRQAAERMLQETCGEDIYVKFISNAPSGVLKTGSNNSRKCKKVFFYKACYNTGSVHLGGDYEDYVWVTRDELKDFLKPDYCKTVLRFVR